MLLKNLFTVLLFIGFYSLNAQPSGRPPGMGGMQMNKRVFSGKVYDSATAKPIADVSVCIYSAKDTSLIQFGFTTPMGNYQLTISSMDSIIISYSITGYYEKWFKKPEHKVGDRMFFMQDVYLTTLPYELKGIRISGSAIKMKGDTMEINANRFKVMPGSDVAQLFKKIPGFEVNVNGEIKVDGATVSKITVDGSDFFGNNPALVSKNLTAEMIEAVQVYEPKNQDGTPTESTDKVINLRLKKDKRNGMFGDVIAGYGTNNRYEAGLRINHFKNDRKISFIYNGNNINGNGFDFGFNNWHRSERESRNGSANSMGRNLFISSENRSGSGNINNRNNAAISYFNEFSRLRKLSFNADISQNNYLTLTNSNIFNALNDTTLRKNSDSLENTGVFREANFRTEFTQKKDSTVELGFGFRTYISLDQNANIQNNKILIKDVLINEGKTNLSTNTQSFQNRINGSYLKRWRKNINYFYTANTTINYNLNEIDENLFNLNQKDTFNNNRKRDNNNLEWLSSLSGNMPIYKNYSASVKAEYWTERTFTNQLTRAAQNEVLETFKQPYMFNIDSLKLKFNNKFEQYSVKPSLLYNNQKGIFFSLGATVLQYNIHSDNQVTNSPLNRSFQDILPYAFMHYRYKKQFMMFSFNQNLSFPDMNDLLPIINLSNNWQRNIGNTALNPTKRNTLFTRYSIRQHKRIRQLSSFLTLENSNNEKIYNNMVEPTSGRIVLKPVNESGYKMLNQGGNLSLRVTKIINFNFNYNLNLAERPYILRNEKSIIKTQDYSFSPQFNISFSDSLELNIKSNFNFNKSRNELNKALNYDQSTNNISADLRTIIRKIGVELSTELSVINRKNIPSIGRMIYLWNFYAQKPIDKKNKFNLKFTAYDILKQNISLTRTTTNGFVSITENNQLQQFFMLSLVYKIKSQSKETNNDVIDGNRRFMR